MKVLCVSISDDAHVPFVQKHLSEEIVIFDPQEFPFEIDITYEWNGSSFNVYSRDRCLSDCDAIWYRKPVLLGANDLPVDELYRDFTFSAYQKTIHALYSLLQDKVWVSDYWAILRGSNKLRQAEIAHSLGLNVPRTIATSSAVKAKSFILSLGSVVTKMMGTQHIYDGKTSSVFYTAAIDAADVDSIDLDGLCVAPAIFQERIHKAYDVRLTIVGDQAFPCEIHQNGAYAGAVDWRIGIFDETALSYVPHQMPDCIIASCKQMLAQMNLKYGAFDFIVDDRGEYWFVEVNPNGQWAFVEMETGLEISKAFVDVFANK